MRRVGFVDTSIRDGNQSLWAGMGMSTDTILPIAPTLDRVGFEALDFTNSMLMWAAVKHHHEDPWERIRLVAEAMPNTKLGFMVATQRFITWITPSAVQDMAMRALVRNGIRRFWIIDPGNDMKKVASLARVIKGAGDAEVFAGVSYALSPLHTDEYFQRCIEQLRDVPEVDEVYLKDAGGLLTPDRVATLIPAIRDAVPNLPFRELHTHANTGLAPLNHLAALEQGLVTLHTAIGPLSNGTSHPSVEQTIKNVQAAGYHVDLNRQALAEVDAYFRMVALRDALPVGTPVEYDGSYYEHQVPGGMVSTMRRQLAEIGMADRLSEVLDEVPRVRKDLGYPIMITPLAQFVGTQAMANVVTGDRYSVVSEEIIAYIEGFYGEPLGPVEQRVIDRVADDPRLDRVRELIRDDGLAAVAAARDRLSPGISDEELVLRMLISDGEVDALRHRPRLSGSDVTLSSVHTLLRAISRRPEISNFVLERPRVRIEMRR